MVATTLKGMSRIEEIRQKRERAFYKNRMKGNKERQLAADRKLVEDNPELLRLREVELRRKAEKLAAKENAMEEDEEIVEEDEDEDEEEMESEDEEMESESEEETVKQKVLLKNKRKARK